MFDKLFKAIEARFGKKVADAAVVVGVLIYLYGIIIGFKGDFVIGLFSLMLLVPPLIVGLVSIFTLGSVNLSAIIGTWLFTTAAGKVVGISFCVVAFAIILWRLPDAINKWASDKVSIK